MHTDDPDTLLDALTTVTRSGDVGESNDTADDTDSLDDHECEQLDLDVDAILAAVRALGLLAASATGPAPCRTVDLVESAGQDDVAEDLRIEKD